MAWLLIQTKPNAEQYAEAALTIPYRGCTVYFPKIKVQCAHAGRVAWVERPFLSRYAFVDDGNGHRVIRTCPGVMSVMYQAATRSVQLAVAEIQAREVLGFVKPEGVAYGLRFKKNNLVRITDRYHPMYGFQGIFDAHCGFTRGQILIQAVCGSFKVELPLKQMELV